MTAMPEPDATAFVQVLAPAGAVLEDLHSAALSAPFAPATLDFLGELGTRLMALPQARTYPELMAAGFWLRPAALEALRRRCLARLDRRAVLLPRGTALHVTPANVDTQFLYSWALSLLAGNRNLVRLSGRERPLQDLLAARIDALLAQPRHRALAQANRLIRYPHDAAASAALSARVQLRIVWGGDATVAALRRVPLPADALELCFPDRLSLALLDAAGIADQDPAALARALYNDVYAFGQLACSSPRQGVWWGGQQAVARGREPLWAALQAHAATAAEPAAGGGTPMDRLVAAQLAACDGAASRVWQGPLLTRIELRAADPARLAGHCGGGLLYEHRIADLDGLLPWLDPGVQTCSYAGLPREALAHWLARALPAGGLRFVPLGQALTFSDLWDGLALLEDCCRVVEVL